eukprot:5457138-Alexandrium_andersonii.AAC.1
MSRAPELAFEAPVPQLPGPPPAVPGPKCGAPANRNSGSATLLLRAELRARNLALRRLVKGQL